MYNIIDAIIIDTSALEKYQFDFLGWTNQTITSLYNLLMEKNIELLTHFVLDNEIKNHIPKSSIVERTENLELTLRRNKDFFKLIDISTEEAIEKLKKIDLKQAILSEYINLYSRAKILPFTEPEDIFKAYFNEEPPFSTANNKKSEFPDAFIINAVKKYVDDNPTVNILVVSDDSDWHNAFKTAERISICNSIDDAILTIQTADKIMPVIEDNTEAILSAISFWADCEAYDISEYETTDDVYVKKVQATNIYDIIPLKISASSVFFKCTANLKAEGSVRIIDYDHSYYDKEDRAYYYIAYSDIEFENADAIVECEINLDFSSNNAEVSVTAKIVTDFDIELDLSDAEITTTACPEDELALEVLREDKGYYNNSQKCTNITPKDVKRNSYPKNSDN